MPVYTIPVDTEGDAGAATGTAQLDLDLTAAMLLAVKVSYHASAPETTVVTLTEAEGLGRTLLAVPAGNTDAVLNPVDVLHDAAGAELGQYTRFVVEGRITVAVTACDELTDAVTVSIQVLANSAVR